MINLLAKIFIKDRNNVSSPIVHGKYGMLSGIVGIGFNLLLFAGKLLAGLLSSSIAIMADAFNNLSDAGTSLTTLVCFKLAGHKPDSDHPFGHGRFEYIAGLIVSMAILLMGIELGKTSIDKIINRSDVVFSLTVVIILVVSICVKLYMFIYNTALSKKIGSSSLKATAMDSISDTLGTTAVLISMLLVKFVGINIDGYCGLLVAVLILVNGYKSLKETISPLLGQRPDADYVQNIEAHVMAHPEVIGMHDLVVHDYGPGRFMLSLHAEVDANEDFIHIHDAIDNIERELSETFNCTAVIHMDPIVTDDAKTDATSQMIKDLVKTIDSSISIHDFRMVSGPTHTNIIFDVAAPFSLKLSDSQIKEEIIHLVKGLGGNYIAKVTVDRLIVNTEV